MVWGAGVLAYTSAVLQRTTLGVSGTEAASRFDASASVVSVFVVVQLLVYALGQIPAGLLLDRYGSRVTLTAGALLMALGQVLIAHSDDVGLAILARVVVGSGDALTFVSAVRLVSAWLPARRVPLFTQLTGLIGQAGQILSAIPFLALLHAQGWTAAFTASAAVSLGAAVIAVVLVRGAPAGTPRPVSRGLRRIPSEIAAIIGHPATRLGFWSHFTAGFPGIVFALMWGFPYMTQGEGLSLATASAVMSVLVIAGVFAGPLIAAMTQRHPLRRSTLVLIVTAGHALPLLAIVLWPGPAPLWLIVVMVIGFAVGGPGSGVGFDFPRTALPGQRLGTATGVVIMGAFSGALLGVLLIGLLLDAFRGAGASEFTAFRLAFAVQLPLLAVGVIGMLGARRALRRRMAEVGRTVPSWREVWHNGRWRRL